MEILMDFNKPSISKKIEKFLLDNLKTEKEKESLINVTTGKSVLKCDVKQFEYLLQVVKNCLENLKKLYQQIKKVRCVHYYVFNVIDKPKGWVSDFCFKTSLEDY